jgi:hypothetical protein
MKAYGQSAQKSEFLRYMLDTPITDDEQAKAKYF